MDIRSVHVASVPIRAAVFASTSRFTRSGACTPSHSVVRPPMDTPHTCARAKPTASINDKDIAPQPLDVIVALRRAGRTVPAGVVAKHSEPLRERRHLRVPQRPIGAERIGEHQRRRVRRAGDLVGEPAAIFRNVVSHGPRIIRHVTSEWYDGRMRLLRLVLAFLVMGSGISAAQAPPLPRRTIAGIVVDAGTRAPIVAAVVSTGDALATTDQGGRFTFETPAGEVVVQVTASGYFPLTTTLDARGADVRNAELALARDTGFATSVDVVAASPVPAPATTVVQPVQVLRTPGALDNVYRTLQTLPGVAATEEFGSRLAVRGGSPDQNLTMMDGVEIHDPYRLFGLTSAFNPETIQRFELATGGFSVKYGDRLSSVLVIENRDGVSGQGLSGSAALSITDANVVLEGGLPGDAVGSWLVTGRRTYYDLVAARITDQEFPAFADVQAKGVWEPAPGRRLTLFGLSSRQAAAIAVDEDDARGEIDDDTENDLAWLRFDASLGTRGQSHTVVGYSDTRSTFGVDAAFEDQGQRSNAPGDIAFGVANVQFQRALTVTDVSVRQELAWTLGTHVVETGAEAHQLSTGLRFEVDGDRNQNAANGSSQQGGAGLPDLLDSSERYTRGGAWLQDRWQLGARALVEAGLRFDYAGITGDVLASPRVAGTVNLNPSSRIKAALGMYTQSPGYEKLAQSDYVLDFTNDAVRSLSSERSTQVSVGLERDLPAGAMLRVEGYYKRFSDLLVGLLETEEARLARVARYDFPADLAWSIPVDPVITTVPANDGRGRAYGFDLFLSRTAPPLTPGSPAGRATRGARRIVTSTARSTHSSTTGVTRSRPWPPTDSRRAGSSARPCGWPRGFHGRRRSAYG